MSGRPRIGRRWSHVVTAVFALSLVAGMLSAGPAAAHSFTRSDPDDTRGVLDLRSASVVHTPNAVVHSFRTFAGWAPRDLGRLSSFFVIGLDRDNDPSEAERCVLIYYRSRLRATLFNCISGATIGQLPISKPNRTTVKVNIPKAQTGLSYRWSVVSLYFEKKPCLNGCVDGVPNLSGFILHDLIPPSVSINTDTLRVWEADTDATFNFPFSVSDTGGAGVATWRIQKREPGGVWEDTGVSGTGGGAKNPTVPGEEGTRNLYRVVVVDEHANRTNGPGRLVYIPTDDDDLDPADFSTAPTPEPDALAFGGTYSPMAATDVFTYEFTAPVGDCTFEIIGPGDGDWSVSVVADGGDPEVVAAPGGGQRQTLYTDDSCAATYEVTVDSGSGFAIDAVVGTSVP